jgi:hypothetical protein
MIISHKIMRHVYSDTDSSIEPNTQISSNSQHSEIFLKFVMVNL